MPIVYYFRQKTGDQLLKMWGIREKCEGRPVHCASRLVRGLPPKCKNFGVSAYFFVAKVNGTM
jgi:hypothetical protein